MRAGFEGGQMPLHMRLPKQRGNTSKDAMPVRPFMTHTVPVNVRDLERVFADGDTVNIEALIAKRLIKNTKYDIKILGNGELTKKLSVTAHGFSATAREKINAAGGSATALREPADPRKKRGKKGKGKAKPAAEAPEPAESEADEPSSESPEA
jgi:large subunit ribosomal protein L15